MRETRWGARWGEMVKRRVITWLQNHRRSRHERQINFPELCMDNSIAIWRTSRHLQYHRYYHLHARIRRLQR